VFTYYGICKTCTLKKMGIGFATPKKRNVKIKRWATFGCIT
jgi:hypothetical protein